MDQVRRTPSEEDIFVDSEFSDPAATRLQMCKYYDSQGLHREALAEASTGYSLAQETLVSSIEIRGFMPVNLVATLVVAQYNMGYQHAVLGHGSKAISAYSGALEIADRHLGGDHSITDKVRNALNDLLLTQDHETLEIQMAEHQQMEREARQNYIQNLYPPKVKPLPEIAIPQIKPNTDEPKTPPGMVRDPYLNVFKPLIHLSNCPMKNSKAPEEIKKIAQVVGYNSSEKQKTARNGVPWQWHPTCLCKVSMLAHYKQRSPWRQKVADDFSQARRELRANMERINAPNKHGANQVLSQAGLKFLTSSSGSDRRDRATLPKKVLRTLERNDKIDAKLRVTITNQTHLG